MRIVHVANFYSPRSGGIRTAMHAMAGQYLSRGHEPVLVVPDKRDGVSTVDGVKVVSLAAPRVPFSGGYRAVVRSLTSSRSGASVSSRPRILPGRTTAR